MKKLFSLLTVMFIMLSLSVPAFATTDVLYDEIDVAAPSESATQSGDIVNHGCPFIVDNADLLTDDEEIELNAYLRELSEKVKCAIVVDIEDDIDSDIEVYSEMYYRYIGFGYGDNYDGVLMTLRMSDRYAVFYAKSGRADYCIDDFDSLLSAFGSGLGGTDNWKNGIKNFANCAYTMLNGTDYDSVESDYLATAEYETFADDSYYIDSDGRFVVVSPVEYPYAIVIIVGIAAAVITVLIMKGKNKTVHFAKSADSYEVPGSFNLRVSEDRFLYRTVNRTAKPKPSESHSSGGGGFSGGGSSGGSHGGGHF